MTDIAGVLLEAIAELRAHRVYAPEFTARLLLADTLTCDQAWLVAHSADQVQEVDLDRYRKVLRERCDGVPTQYIRGVQEFYGLEFRVNPDVLIPRPETEHVVEATLQRIRPGDVVADIGTGCGTIAVSVALHAPGATVTASDISRPALAVAAENARRLGARVHFSAGDLCAAIRDESLDMIVSNPPYVPLRDAASLQREMRYEPSTALFGGEQGLELTGRLASGAARALKPGGWLLAEIGFGSRPGIEALLQRPHWDQPEFYPDLAGIERVVAVRRRR